jgi:transposase-like protein
MGRVEQFKKRQFTTEVILWAVCWYLLFPISYRDLELMLPDRRVSVDHTTILRWTQTYAPALEKRIRPYLRMRRLRAGGRDLVKAKVAGPISYAVEGGH